MNLLFNENAKKALQDLTSSKDKSVIRLKVLGIG
jgi:hypothetical protein